MHRRCGRAADWSACWRSRRLARDRIVARWRRGAATDSHLGCRSCHSHYNAHTIGRGANANPVQAIKWHIIAKAGGVSDIPLDAFVEQQPPDIRAAGEKAAKPWVDALKELRQSRS